MQVSMERYYIMWKPHAMEYSALHTMQTTYWHVPYVPTKHPTNENTVVLTNSNSVEYKNIKNVNWNVEYTYAI